MAVRKDSLRASSLCFACFKTTQRILAASLVRLGLALQQRLSAAAATTAHDTSASAAAAAYANACPLNGAVITAFANATQRSRRT